MEAAIVTQKRGILTVRAVAALHAMQITVKEESGLFVPPSVQRRAGIRSGDRLEFKVSPRTITITTVEPPTYKPTKAELAAIRKGEAEIARGEYVNVTDLLHDLDRRRRKSGTKATRKVAH
jgi:hypothetical protein